MTTITIDLPDDLAALLTAKASANNTTPKSFAQTVLVDELTDRQIDDARLGPYEPSQSEQLVLEKADADIAAGHWVGNSEVFEKVRATLSRD
jgi:predicted transcriptional regulator